MNSAGAESVALPKLVSEATGVKSFAVEWEVVGEKVCCCLNADSSAALSIAKRQGAGKLRNQHPRFVVARESGTKGAGVQYSQRDTKPSAWVRQTRPSEVDPKALWGTWAKTKCG